MRTPNEVNSIELVDTCIGIRQGKWNEYMNGVTRADKRKINRIIKYNFPTLYHELGLEFYNPYNYYKRKNMLILVHSNIEYFFEYN